jgi:hypothetical protein
MEAPIHVLLELIHVSLFEHPSSPIPRG